MSADQSLQLSHFEVEKALDKTRRVSKGTKFLWRGLRGGAPYEAAALKEFRNFKVFFRTGIYQTAPQV